MAFRYCYCLSKQGGDGEKERRFSFLSSLVVLLRETCFYCQLRSSSEWWKFLPAWGQSLSDLNTSQTELGSKLQLLSSVFHPFPHL